MTTEQERVWQWAYESAAKYLTHNLALEIARDASQAVAPSASASAGNVVYEDAWEAFTLLRILMDNTASDDHKDRPPDQYFYFEDCGSHGNVYHRIDKLLDKYERYELLDKPNGEFVRYMAVPESSDDGGGVRPGGDDQADAPASPSELSQPFERSSPPSSDAGAEPCDPLLGHQFSEWEDGAWRCAKCGAVGTPPAGAVSPADDAADDAYDMSKPCICPDGDVDMKCPRHYPRSASCPTCHGPVRAVPSQGTGQGYHWEAIVPGGGAGACLKCGTDLRMRPTCGTCGEVYPF